jgi:hypothetical protein
MQRRVYYWVGGLLAIALVVLAGGAGNSTSMDKAGRAGQDAVEFTDTRSQAVEFIGYHESIALTPEQELIKNTALSSIAAPCCSDFTAATCCCPCNLAKSIWGLANVLIVEHDYGVDQLRQAAVDWIAFTNPAGYSGDACFTAGGCERSFEKNGCGGMGADLL